jgi:hypothetical protein
MSENELPYLPHLTIGFAGPCPIHGGVDEGMLYAIMSTLLDTGIIDQLQDAYRQIGEGLIEAGLVQAPPAPGPLEGLRDAMSRAFKEEIDAFLREHEN